MRTFKHPNGLVQMLAVADLREGPDVFLGLTGGVIDIVYSDPPWNPGNEKYWRTHAGATPVDEGGYDVLLDSWCACIAGTSPAHVFCEQSFNDKHRALFTAAVERCDGWDLPLLEEWTVYYGSPGSRGCSRPNKLLHFGHVPITTDPSGLRGQKMTRVVCDGLDLPAGGTIADPCMGKGMTSREAHGHGWHCVGTELNPKRLEKTIAWLLKKGYEEQEEQ